MKIGLREFDDTKHEKYSMPVSRRGIIEAVNFQAWSADVRIIGGTQSILKNVPLSSIVFSGLRPGDLCVVDVFDENNPNDCVVAYIYHRRPVKVANGTVTVSGKTTIAHNLGVVPNFISFNFGEDPIGDAVWEPQTADSTNLYLQCTSVGGGGSHLVYWYAASI